MQPKVTIRPKEKRKKDFKEVALGFSQKSALEESQRCPQCSDPVCRQGCPLGVDIPNFIRLLREGQSSDALKKIKESSLLASICGRICDAPCQEQCILAEEGMPIRIKHLERFASDRGKPRRFLKSPVKRLGKKIAVIGSGPIGLSAAAELAHKDYQVTVFDPQQQLGGPLAYSIPSFHLPAPVLGAEIEDLKFLGVDFQNNFLLGRTASIDELKKKGFEAVLITEEQGSGGPPEVPGWEHRGVYFGKDFLLRARCAQADSDYSFLAAVAKMIVVGSDRLALDCARVGVRLGKEVTLVSAGIKDEMASVRHAVDLAREEGVLFEDLARPEAIGADEKGSVTGVQCVRMDYADPDSTGKWQLVPVDDSDFVLEAQAVILGLPGTSSRSLAKLNPDLRTTADGKVVLDAKGMTSVQGVFFAACSWMPRGNIADAVLCGRKAASYVEEFLL